MTVLGVTTEVLGMWGAKQTPNFPSGGIQSPAQAHRFPPNFPEAQQTQETFLILTTQLV